MSTPVLRRVIVTLAAAAVVVPVFGVGHAGADTPHYCFGVPATIVGTAGPDTIHGTPGPDVIYADAGDDAVYGYGGGDRICGGPDNDAINGGAGDDSLDGGAGSADQAQYWSAPGPVIASLANRYADGADGRDTLLGFERLVGSQFDDRLIGDSGDNSFIGLERDDIIDGGPGADSVKYNWRLVPVDVDLLTGRASGQGEDQLKAIESVVGTEGNDTITGNSSENSLSGLGGADVIEGLTGADHLYGGPSRDELRGGLGLDHLHGEDGDDVLDGGPGYDPVTALADSGDVLAGGPGIDWATYRSHDRHGVIVSIDGVANDGVLWEGESDNVLADVEDVTGTRFSDTIVGSALANRLFGTEGDDAIRGGAGNDRLQGEAGHDSLDGEAGSDVVYARDGTPDTRVDCGAGSDAAQLDVIDPPPVGCETLL